MLEKLDGIEVVSAKAENLGGTIVNLLVLEMVRYWDQEGAVFGIDPGQRNMGMAAMIYPNMSMIWQLEIPRFKKPVPRMRYIRRLLRRLIKSDDVLRSQGSIDVTIEGASFGDVHGQVPLAEVRAAAALTFPERALVRIVAPSSIRKEVFGSGKRRAQEVWPNLPPDAASALGCALYGIYKQEELDGSKDREET